MNQVVVESYKVPSDVPQKNVSFAKQATETKTPFGDEPRVYLAWAVVTARHSEDLTVDVILDNKINLLHVAVRSLAWAGAGSVGFGERDLPIEDTIVLVLFPHGILEDGVVLCSSFTPYGKHAPAWAVELMKSGKEKEKVVITEPGNKVTEDKTTGDTTIELVSGAAYKIKANGATIEIATDGAINITAPTGKNINVTPGTGGSCVLAGGSLGANDYVACLFSGAPHCNDALQKVKVP